MSFKTLIWLILILFLIPIILGQVDVSSITQLLKNPSQINFRVLQLVFEDLVGDVIDYYKDIFNSAINNLTNTIKQEFQQKEVEINIK